MTILEELQLHSQREKASFHMPGHKKGAGFCGGALESELFQLDTTELCDTDALIEPTGTILQAEQQAASVYGAGHSFYLVNGSSCGILAMVYHNFKSGDVVLVDRNCHRSVIHGLMLAGAEAVYLHTKQTHPLGIPNVISAETIKRQLMENPDAKGVFLTSPNYYGVSADIREIATICHQHGMILLVDEAHGAHFPFAEAFPESAIQQGADMSVVSLHKTLSVPNQAALLHVAAQYDVEKVRSTVAIFQTSSPSFLLLAAMEQGIIQAAKDSKEKTSFLLKELEGIPYADDPFKRLLLYQNRGYSGYEVDEILRTKFGIYAELCDERLVLLMVSWANTKEDLTLLKQAIRYLNALPQKSVGATPEAIRIPEAVKTAITPAAIREGQVESIDFTAAAGRISAGTVSAFPPCIPLVLPGEIIIQEQIDNICRLQEQGARITGLSNNTIYVLK